MSCELYFQEIIKGKKQGFIPFLLKIPLFLLSCLYCFGVFCRNRAYDLGYVRQYTPPVPCVISIGNIAVGGTGKTPVTILLAKNFSNVSTVAIASRGYRSKAERLPVPVLVSKGEGPILPASYCGDEPFLLAENLPLVHVFSGRDRLQASDMAAQAGAQILILDDAFQHRQLARDFDIVLLDAAEPFGKGHFLPYGLLRDSAKSLSRAHLILLNHIQDTYHFNELKEEIAKYSKASVVGIRMDVEKIVDVSGQKVETIRGRKVGIFCGIAHPERFLATVKGLGAEVVKEKYFPDHCMFDHGVLARFAEDCRLAGVDFLICSEKDKVKLDTHFSLPVFWVKMEMNVVEGNEIWNLFIENVKKTLDARVIR